jgi:CBS domain-containing protein
MVTTVSTVLKHKGHNIVTVAPHHTVASVVKVLTENRIGAAPVIDERGQLVGIISERDIIRAMAQHEEAVLKLGVDQLMTRDVKTCSAEDQLVELMQVMTQQRIRHLPVLRDGALDGIVSIGDVVKQRLEEVGFELDELRRYITSS